MAIGSGSTSRGYHYLLPGDAPDLAGITQQLATDINTDVGALAALSTDTGWITCGSGNVSVTGTAKVRRIGIQVYGQLNLTCSGGWPNTGSITAFTLPDTTYAPGGPHRMGMGTAVQATAGSVVLTASSGANAVLAGANGASGGAGGVIQWFGPLWLVS